MPISGLEPRQLTTFPAVFRDDEDVSVNQVIAGLFSKVKSRFSAATATAGGDVSGVAGATAGVPAVSSEAGKVQSGWTDEGKSAAAPRGKREREREGGLEGFHVPDAPALATKTSVSPSIQRTDSTLSTTAQHGRKDGGPLPRRNHLAAAAPAPPLVSVTAVSRMRTRDGTGGSFSSERDSPGALFLEPRNRLPSHPVHAHTRNPSLSSFRPRRGSLSALSMSPSSSSFSAFAVEQLDHTAVPGFPIADDARSLRTVASGRPVDGVSKIIRRLRGEGLRYVRYSDVW